jgi:hypothetical protein
VAGPRQKYEALFAKQLKLKRAGVVEHKVLSSNPITIKKMKND